jgi:hypothetical protein
MSELIWSNDSVKFTSPWNVGHSCVSKFFETVQTFELDQASETRGRKLSNPAYFRLKFCPYTRHKYCWLVPHHNRIPSDRCLERIDTQIERIRMCTFSNANGGREGKKRPCEWKSWNCGETSVSVEERKLHRRFQRGDWDLGWGSPMLGSQKIWLIRLKMD